jgi:hypothetical protein
MLNQNTHFSITELNDDFETPSACHIIYGDHGDSEEMISTEGLSSAQFEKILSEKVAYGLNLPRDIPQNNSHRNLPIATVEAHKYVKHIDDAF